MLDLAVYITDVEVLSLSHMCISPVFSTDPVTVHGLPEYIMVSVVFVVGEICINSTVLLDLDTLYTY